MDIEWEQRVRSAAFAFVRGLQQQHPDLLPASALRHGFELDGQRIGVMSYASGIWKPRHLDAALSVMTTPPKSDEPPPYIDEWMDEARVSYAYRGDDPGLHDNRAMRLAWEHHLPVIYLHGVAKGLYIAEFPVYVSRDRPSDLRVDLVIGTTPDDPAGINVEIDDRQYRVRPTRTRLHQHSFRMRVLRAYEERCAMCSLGHATLLDGAHIVPDGEPTGLPVVPNGLALCKIHHAAYDQYFVGVRPDLRIEVNEDLLEERDGPMLRHGLQDLHGLSLRQLPRRRADKPDVGRLEWRYTKFRGQA